MLEKLGSVLLKKVLVGGAAEPPTVFGASPAIEFRGRPGRHGDPSHPPQALPLGVQRPRVKAAASWGGGMASVGRVFPLNGPRALGGSADERERSLDL